VHVQQGEFKNTTVCGTKSTWGGVHAKNLLLKKLPVFFPPVVFFLCFSLIAFLAVSLHEELQNTIEVSKISKKRQVS
jgi:hypothetical protein